MPNSLRVGAVSYLNTKPLVYGLEARAPEIELLYDLPSRLADRLASGALDVALIPSIEYFLDPSYSIVSDACIACRGPVLSVKLLSRVPLPQIRRLALDEGSRTSVAMTRILLRERYGLSPEFERLPIGEGPESTDADAVLLIGDRAIHAAQEAFVEVWDLGDQWVRWAERPFVFAMWTARAGVDTADLSVALETARDDGCGQLSTIADQESPNVGMERSDCLAYLRDNLHFHLGPAEREGLQQFYQFAAQLDLIPERAPHEILRFHDCESY